MTSGAFWLCWATLRGEGNAENARMPTVGALEDAGWESVGVDPRYVGTVLMRREVEGDE